MRRPFSGFSSASAKFLGLGVAWVVAALAFAAPNELGHPIIREFPPGKAQINHLCPAVAQDALGFVYLANSTEARCYDGEKWWPVRLPTESAGIRQFAVAADGTVYAGGAGVIGYFRGWGANCTFVSLAASLPPTATGCDDLFDVLAVGDTVYFADEEKILIWRERHFTVVPCSTPPHSRGARLHCAGDTIYVTALARPLCRLVNDRLEIVADGPVFRENPIIAVEAGPAGTLALLTAGHGFFQLDNGRVAPLAVEANRWLAGRTIFRAQRLGDGGLVVAFTSVSGDGGMRFDAAGRYVGPLDNSIGLYVKTLRGFCCDREGGLWIGSETGLFRLDWPSGVTVFDGINGLGQGTVADVTRHAGVLYAATSEGVYRLVPSDDRDGHCARFERLFTQPVYSVLSHPGGLLAFGYTEVSVLSSTGFIAVAKVPPGGGSLHRSQHDPDRVWLRTTRGVQAIHRTATGWRDEELVPDSELNSRGLPRAAVDDLVAGPDGVRWRATARGIFQVSAPGGASRRLPQAVHAAAGAWSTVWEEADGAEAVLWICGTQGLVRVEVARAFPAAVPFAMQLSATGVRAGDRLAPGHTAVTFDYLALRHQIAQAVTYQTRLIGSDEDWSPWSLAHARSFTSLPPGDYRFEVRARDADGQFTAPAALAFAVLAPWWRTGWALLAYAAALLGSVTGVVRLRSRAWHRRAARLEGVVAERTAELARKNTELVRLHQLELDEKISARLAEEKARLEVLRYQLNPHFLFNTLASISASLPVGPSTARAMVERLAEFCRLTLHRADDRDWTTVGEELKLLRAYLEIEQSRWGDLLDVEIACDPVLDGEELPHFLLLPLLENALKYGRATSPERVGLRLVARREPDGALALEVANTGAWIEPAAKKSVLSLGIGLDNLRERLARHYPRSHYLAIAHAGGWVTVTLRLSAARTR